jgi:redox-sensitive bicupin YhaK (pirin superfamily)
MNGPEHTITDSHVAEVGGLAVHRALPQRGRRTVGAWCFLDHFGPVDVTPVTTMKVGPHPHIGLHTVTWLLSGEVLHTDSLGSEQPIRPGQLNLMTAGAGIAHAEDGRDHSSGTMEGVQLWVAQPEATRHGPSSFVHHAELPTVDLPAGQATILVGPFAGSASPAHVDSPLMGVDIVGRGTLDLPLDPAFEHAIVVLHGEVRMDDATAAPHQLLYLGGGRDEVRLILADRSRVLLLGGEPFAEEILMWWNFVARDRAEMDQARADWEGGTARFGEVTSTLERIGAPRPIWAP